MKIPRLKPGDPVLVTWVDANSPKDTTWVEKDDFRQDSPIMEILSLGFYIEKKMKYIRMSACRSESDDYNEVLNRTVNIPIGCIKSIRRLK
jgi:hypothetical protein